jgi:hypothetical protein
MLKKTIKYVNYNGEEKEREAYFHLGKADIARLSADASVLQEMNDAFEKKDHKKMLATIERLVRLSYGIRSEDGERFVKTREVQADFINSAAYEEFLMNLLGDPDNFNSFVRAILPEAVLKSAIERLRSGENSAALEAAKKQGVDVERIAKFFEETPAEEENGTEKVPTKAELLNMPPAEILATLRKHPKLAQIED